MRHLICIFIICFNNLAIKLNAQLSPDWVSYYAQTKTLIQAIEVDPARNCIYIAGVTFDSSGIATSGVHKEDLGLVSPISGVPPTPLFLLNCIDIFIAKFDMEGNNVWGTYFGGLGQEILTDLKIDNEGNVIIYGNTTSLESIATAGAYQTLKFEDTISSPFLAKFNANNGTVSWASYYGNEYLGARGMSALCIDQNNNIYIGGDALSGGIEPSFGAHQTTGNGFKDGYIAKFSPTGSLIWATYLGGEGIDNIADLHIAPDASLYVLGATNSFSQIATSGTYQPVNLIPAGDSVVYGCTFINKFSTDGERIWGTYISADSGSFPGFFKYIVPRQMASDKNSNLYIFGKTTASDYISTAGTYRTSIEGGSDYFLMQFDNLGQKNWGTYLGVHGSDVDTDPLLVEFNWIPNRFEVNSGGDKIFLFGSIFEDSIATSCSPYEIGKTFISRFDGTGNLEYTQLYPAAITGIHLDPFKSNNAKQDLYFIGRTDQEGLATPGAFKETMGGLPYSGIFGKLVETCPESVAAPIAYAAGVLSLDTSFTHYTWYHNGIAVAGADEATLNVGADSFGYYYAKFKICACTYYSDTFFFDPLSVEESLPVTNQVQLIPNPAHNQVRLSLPADAKDLFMVQVLDPMGRSLWRQDHFPQGTKNLNISVKDFPKGLYYVQVQTQDKVWVQALVVE